MHLKTFIFLFVLNIAGLWAAAQPAASIATDVSILRSFTPGHRFWSFGQAVQGIYHIKQKESLYAQVSYYTNGKSKNELQATAKDAATLPQTTGYTAYTAVRLRHLSLGWQHYFAGTYDNELGWNLYGRAGFGLLAGRAETRHDVLVDTALYQMPQQALAGSAPFKRLTFDVSLGTEIVLGAGVYLYTDVRTWIPASDFPSSYLYSNNLPRTLMLNGGIRVLFD